MLSWTKLFLLTTVFLCHLEIKRELPTWTWHRQNESVRNAHQFLGRNQSYTVSPESSIFVVGVVTPPLFFTSLNIRTYKQGKCILAQALPSNPIRDRVSPHWRQAQNKPGLLKILVCSFTRGMSLLGVVHFLSQDLKALFFSLFLSTSH